MSLALIVILMFKWTTILLSRYFWKVHKSLQLLSCFLVQDIQGSAWNIPILDLGWRIWHKILCVFFHLNIMIIKLFIIKLLQLYSVQHYSHLCNLPFTNVPSPLHPPVPLAGTDKLTSYCLLQHDGKWTYRKIHYNK